MCALAFFRRGVLVCLITVLSACAGYSGSDLVPGRSTRLELVASMGVPAMSWKAPDGREQLAYPRGPAGTQTFMAYLTAAGVLERIEAVLDVEHFAQIRAGSDMA